MDGKRSSKDESSGSSDEIESQEDIEEDVPKSEEEEDKGSNKSHSDNELGVMKLRRKKTQRSTYSFRTDRRNPRGTRTKKSESKRKQALAGRGRKKAKNSYDKPDWSKRSESESEESFTAVEHTVESQALPIVEKFLYKPGVPWPDLTPYLQQLIEIRIAREYINPLNKQVKERQLWGNEVYTSESDIVAAMHHVGLINIWNDLSSQYEGVAVIARVTKGRNNYISCIRNGIRSKRCTNYEGHSIKPERIILLPSLGKLEELVEMAKKMPTDFPKIRQKPNLNTKTMKIIPGTYFIFNISFEPAIPYSLENFGDKGWDEAEFVSAKLKENALYVETSNKRFEISLVSEGEEDQIFEHQDKYRWAEVKFPIMFKDIEFMKENRVPLDENYVSVIYKNLDWTNIEWSSTSVFVNGVEYGPLKCFKYIPIHD